MHHEVVYVSSTCGRPLVVQEHRTGSFRIVGGSSIFSLAASMRDHHIVSWYASAMTNNFSVLQWVTNHHSKSMRA